jgi:hypothetical protein
VSFWPESVALVQDAEGAVLSCGLVTTADRQACRSSVVANTERHGLWWTESWLCETLSMWR